MTEEIYTGSLEDAPADELEGPDETDLGSERKGAE